MDHGKGVPFLDLITPHLELETQLIDAARTVITSAMFIGGPAVEGFEREFAEFCQTKYCVAVNSGTDALRFALMAAGIGGGDIVVTVPNSFAATVEAIVQAGAIPQFVDVEPETSNMSVEALRTHLRGHSGERIKAIMPVHLYGQMCDMDAITALAEEHGLMVFEDACQAHGSEYFSTRENRWLKAGSIGKAAGFSFYPGKNLGACGEGGAVTTDDETLAQRVRMIRDHGQNKKYHHLIEGYNGRLDSMQAAILRIKLPHLRKWNDNRRRAAENYNHLLKEVVGVKAPSEPEWSRGIYHLYVVRVQQRDEVQRHLSELNIGTGLHYPIPLHLQKAYEHLGHSQGDFPLTEQLARELLSLPMFPHIQKDQQAQVVEALSAREVLR
jgi:dTDP-4-amino-4,6-dideoxygalactose transaminase